MAVSGASTLLVPSLVNKDDCVKNERSVWECKWLTAKLSGKSILTAFDPLLSHLQKRALFALLFGHCLERQSTALILRGRKWKQKYCALKCLLFPTVSLTSEHIYLNVQYRVYWSLHLSMKQTILLHCNEVMCRSDWSNRLMLCWLH